MADIMKKELIFSPVGERWQQINHAAGESAKSLADTLLDLKIIIDDDAQFCRIIRYYEEYQETIVYRRINTRKITITIHHTQYD